MKILIRGRAAIERISETPFPERTMLISITDAKEEPVHLKNKPDYLLRLSFDDVSEEVIYDEAGEYPTPDDRLRIEKKYNMFTSEQAVELASFYFQNIDKADILICQCEHGISRSAAVAAAILELRGRRGIQIFANDTYYPNKTVFRKTFAALKARIPKRYSV